MATALAFGCERLEGFRKAAEQLLERPQLGREYSRRGDPEPIAEIKHPQWTATLYDLLTAYAQQRQNKALSHVRFAKRTVWSLAEAREALERLIGQCTGLEPARSISDQRIVVEPAMRATVVASSFASGLELVREGVHGDASARSLRAALYAQASSWRTISRAIRSAGRRRQRQVEG